MKIRITSNPITGYGSFSKGQILESGGVIPESFLRHLVEDAGAGEYLEYETKVDTDYEPKKKGLTSQSLPADKAPIKKTRGRPRKKPLV